MAKRPARTARRRAALQASVTARPAASRDMLPSQSYFLPESPEEDHESVRRCLVPMLTTTNRALSIVLTERAGELLLHVATNRGVRARVLRPKGPSERGQCGAGRLSGEGSRALLFRLQA